MKRSLIIVTLIALLPWAAFSQNKFNGLEMNMGNLSRLSDAKTRSISPENFSGEKGKAGMADPADKDKPNTANAFNAARDLGQEVCYWYQADPHAKFPAIPSWRELEVY